MNSNQCVGNGGWLIDYGVDVDVQASDLIWASQIIDDPNVESAILGFEVQPEENVQNNSCAKKRSRMESCAAPGTKACREKMRREKLNDRFAELCSILEPGKLPKADKVAILSDAARLLNQLQQEAKKLKESNGALRDSIKNLKAEKLELRDEKVQLKTQKERIEQMLKGISTTSPFMNQTATAAAFHAAPAYGKPLAYSSNYMPMGMWQWIPPAALDTSQDHVLRPPVA